MSMAAIVLAVQRIPVLPDLVAQLPAIRLRWKAPTSKLVRVMMMAM